jgi:hypothetical protein
MRPLNLQNVKKITANAVFNFFSDLSCEGNMVLILAIADLSATKNISPLNKGTEKLREITHNFLNYYWDFYRPQAFRNFITGEEVMKITGKMQGKEIGECLRKIKLAYAKGLVKNKNDIIKILNN